MIRFSTAGESHGEALIALIQGLQTAHGAGYTRRGVEAGGGVGAVMASRSACNLH